MNKDFNHELQADFVTIKVKENNYEILNIVDVGTANGERIVMPSRDAKIMMQKLEERWICKHGAPKTFSADNEFCRPFFVHYLNGHKVDVKIRPARSSNKNGKVERSNSVFKQMLNRMARELTNASVNLLIARASLMTSLLYGR